MANIEERKTKNGETRYRVKVRIKGHPHEIASFTTKTDAKKWAAQTETAIRQGKYFGTREARRRTLGEAIDRYIADVLPRKPKSETKQKAQLEWWKGKLGAFRLCDVTPARITAERDALARETSAGNANRYAAVLSHLFSVAVKEWQWCDDTPFRKVARLKEP